MLAADTSFLNSYPRNKSTPGFFSYNLRFIQPLRGIAVPAISMFYGIVIYLYFFDDERHKLPHIHAKYQGQDASSQLSTAAC